MSDPRDALQKTEQIHARLLAREGAMHDLRRDTAAELGHGGEDAFSNGAPIALPSGPRITVDFAALRRAGALPPESQERRLAEEYRQIKRPLLHNASGRSQLDLPRANVVMVTSPMPGDGKTFTCINLALSIAREKDWRVVLVDGDVATGRLSRLFGLDQSRGLLDLLRSPELSIEQCVRPTDLSRLFILPAGTHDEEATELLASQRMEKLVRAVSESDDARLVLFDSPPLLVASEATVLSAHAGQVALVVKAGHSTHQQVQQAIEKLDPELVVGLILNQAELGSETLAYGGYGYYRQGGISASQEETDSPDGRDSASRPLRS